MDYAQALDTLANDLESSCRDTQCDMENTVFNLIKDLEAATRSKPSQDVLGTLSVNMSVLAKALKEERAGRIKWPNGDWSQGIRAFANNHVVIRQGATTPIYWFPPE